MVGSSSKILTVSYGTFSCTLEGFDDSFSTMKAIAEYFRDLASDDRYFGAEPPTPDAEMLTRIAEREISRRVEARSSDNGIVLRAASALTAGASQAAQKAADQPEQDIAEQETADQDTVVAMPPLAQPPAEDAHTNEAAARVASAVQSKSEVAAPPTDEMADESHTSMTFADMAPPAPTPDVPAHPDSESVAAKLQRIRAVVGNKAQQSEEAFAEDLDQPVDIKVADKTADKGDIALSDATTEEAHAADPMPEFEDTSAQFEAQDTDTEEVAQADDIDERTADAETDQVQEPHAEEDTETYAEDVPDNTTDDHDTDVTAQTEAQPKEMPTVRARIVRLRKEEVVTEDVAISAPADDNDAAEDMFGITDNLAAEPAASDDTLEAEMPEVAIDDSAADDPDADDGLNLAALDDADDTSDLDDAAPGSLSPEQEAELQEELAEVEQEMADTRSEGRAGRDILPKTDDAAMSRIMSQTDAALEEPEGNRRRNAIAQLKAAVAATEAARQLGERKSDDATGENAFRDDLHQVVRPRRPGRPEAASDLRSERPRPAPLKLVASQRVDTPEASTGEAVKPRRIPHAAEVAATTDASSFAEFAAEMGATELPDLLEAAAAYTAYVEGNEDFSRPQIMKKVQLTIDEEISREDGLRSFGTLIRQGRISKVRNGRFQVSAQTRFKPEARAAQG